MPRIILTALAAILICGTADAALVTATAEFHHGDKDMIGYLAWDDGHPEPRPGVLLLHGWSGPESYVRARAEQLARLGFVALAADIYRRGEKPRTPSELLVDERNFKNNRTLFQARALSALELLTKQPQVDAGHLAVVGYEYAGLTGLDLARAVGTAQGVVLLDAPLDQPLATGGGSGARLLLLQGGSDPAAAQLAAQLPPGGDWQLTLYSGAGAATDRRAWTALLQFLGDLFGPDARH